jgi:hypothetical protein
MTRNLRTKRKAESGKRKLNCQRSTTRWQTNCAPVLEWNYPFVAATKRKAKSSVTELRRAGGGIGRGSGAGFHAFKVRFTEKRIPGSDPGLREIAVAAETGTAHHKFLQHFTLENADDLAVARTRRPNNSSRRCFDRRRARGAGFGRGGGVLEFAAGPENSRPAAGLCQTRIAVHGKIQPGGSGRHHRRERRKPGWRMNSWSCRAWRIWWCCLPEEIWLVDFKTDEIKPGELTERKRHYERQLKLYAGALSRIYARPAVNCWLHFLAARQTVDIKI